MDSVLPKNVTVIGINAYSRNLVVETPIQARGRLNLATHRRSCRITGKPEAEANLLKLSDDTPSEVAPYRFGSAAWLSHTAITLKTECSGHFECYGDVTTVMGS